MQKQNPEIPRLESGLRHQGRIQVADFHTSRKFGTEHTAFEPSTEASLRIIALCALPYIHTAAAAA
jgi:hypothetical protein